MHGKFGENRKSSSRVGIWDYQICSRARKDRLTLYFYAHLKLYPGLPWEKHQTFYQQTEGKFKEETIKVPRLEHIFILC